MELKSFNSYLSSDDLTIPCAMGCSDSDSSEAAYFNISFSSYSLLKDIVSVTPNSPLVNVPVLSKIIAWIFLACSNAFLFLMSKPFFAESAVETAITRGTASPRACGQAITITVTVLDKAKLKLCPVNTSHTNIVNAPAVIAIIVNQNAALLARF